MSTHVPPRWPSRESIGSPASSMASSTASQSVLTWVELVAVQIRKKSARVEMVGDADEADVLTHFGVERLCRKRGHFFCTEHGFYVPF